MVIHGAQNGYQRIVVLAIAGLTTAVIGCGKIPLATEYHHRAKELVI